MSTAGPDGTPALRDRAVTGPRRNARYTVLPVDGPVPWQMIRAVPALRSDPLAWMASANERWGDLVAIPLPRTPVLLVNTPPGARRVLADNARAYSKATVQYGALSLVTGPGLLTTDGSAWRRRRRIAQPAFHHGTLEGVVGHAVRAAQRVVKAWEASAEKVRDVDADVMQATLEVVGSALFGDRLAQDAEDGRHVVNAVHEALSVVIARARTPLPLPAWVPTPSGRRLRRSVEVLDRTCGALVDRRLTAGRRRAPSDTGDLLGLLLDQEDGEGGLSPREVRDELVTLVIAGHETVASALGWTLHLLGEHPDVQREVQAELDAVLGVAGGASVPTWEDLAALRLTRAVLLESLRLFPPAWVISRRAVEADEVDGVPVPAGTLVIISPWLLHRREDCWVNATSFVPHRFWDDAQLAGRATRAGAYLPFGAGPRLCIGRDFALVEATAMLATFLQHCSVTPAGVKPRTEALVTLRPRGGMLMKVTRRLPT